MTVGGGSLPYSTDPDTRIMPQAGRSRDCPPVCYLLARGRSAVESRYLPPRNGLRHLSESLAHSEGGLSSIWFGRFIGTFTGGNRYKLAWRYTRNAGGNPKGAVWRLITI